MAGASLIFQLFAENLERVDSWLFRLGAVLDPCYVLCPSSSNPRSAWSATGVFG